MDILVRVAPQTGWAWYCGPASRLAQDNSTTFLLFKNTRELCADRTQNNIHWYLAPALDRYTLSVAQICTAKIVETPRRINSINSI